MLRTNYLLLLLYFCGVLSVSGQQPGDSLLKLSCSEHSYTSYLPVSNKPLEVIRHTDYALGYAEPHEQAAWVCYVLSKTECKGEEKRGSSFYPDNAVTTVSATNADYKSSGYDRGHLAPAGDMSFSATAMKESFYYSNMSPQVPAFNRGIWKLLESQVRTWGQVSGPLLVITGPVLTDSLPFIGVNEVAVPDWYYKIVVNPSSVPPQAIGFLLRNEASEKNLYEFAVTVDAIEAVTGIDFLPGLPEADQQKIESQVNGSYWKGMDQVKITPDAPSLPKKCKVKKEKHTK